MPSIQDRSPDENPVFTINPTLCSPSNLLSTASQASRRTRSRSLVVTHSMLSVPSHSRSQADQSRESISTLKHRHCLARQGDRSPIAVLTAHHSSAASVSRKMPRLSTTVAPRLGPLRGCVRAKQFSGWPYSSKDYGSFLLQQEFVDPAGDMRDLVPAPSALLYRLVTLPLFAAEKILAPSFSKLNLSLDLLLLSQLDACLLRYHSHRGNPTQC